jgi:two-component system response regulator BasR
MSLLKRWRQRGMVQPVLILTARDALDERVAGLDRGADDYMVKPFALAELLARVRALLRRDQKLASNQIISGDLMLDLQQKTVTLAGTPVVLTRREFALLRRLVMQAGKLVSRERLQEDIYDWQDDIGSNALEVHIHHLRRKLGTTRIRTVRGEGYCLELQP